MTLASFKSAFLHNKLVMRFGCCLVAVSVLMSCWATPKAKAVVSEGALLGSIFGSLLVSMGYSWAAENMDMPSFGEAIYKEMKEFDEALKNDSGLSFLADLNLTLLTPLGAGKIGFPVQWVRVANSFAEWFEGKYFDSSDTAVVMSGGLTFTAYTTFNNNVVHYPYSFTCMATSPTVSLYTIADIQLTRPGEYIGIFTSAPEGQFFTVDGASIYVQGEKRNANDEYWQDDKFCVKYNITQSDIDSGTSVTLKLKYNALPKTLVQGVTYPIDTTISYFGIADASSLTAEKPQEVHYPDVAEDGSQVYEITVDGVTATDIEGIIQGAVDRILAGTASIAGEVTQAQDVPVEPEAPPELDGLDLPALGAALTSRFPFSIPWDFARGVKLLAAPAETPYFEVDFFAPISDMVGGWKGSTKIVLDFSEFEIIGTVCRWTSTIGFCLMLASSTKRLIWVA